MKDTPRISSNLTSPFPSPSSTRSLLYTHSSLPLYTHSLLPPIYSLLTPTLYSLLTPHFILSPYSLLYTHSSLPLYTHSSLPLYTHSSLPLYTHSLLPPKYSLLTVQISVAEAENQKISIFLRRDFNIIYENISKRS